MKRRRHCPWYYHLSLEGEYLHCWFIIHASSNKLVREVEEWITTTHFEPGPLLKIDGQISAPIAFVIAHRLGNLYDAVAVYDLKMKGYVVVISRTPDFVVGDLIDPD